MATTWVDIANMALIHLGAKTINSLEDERKSARLCKSRIRDTARTVFRLFPWNGCTKRVILAPLATAPSFGYTYAYNLPSDYLAVQQVNGSTFGYKVEAKLLLANTDSVELLYTFDQDNPVLIDQTCAEAIALRLAIDICESLTQDNTMKQVLIEQAKVFMKQARHADSVEDPDNELEITTFTDARRSQGVQTKYRQ